MVDGGALRAKYEALRERLDERSSRVCLAAVLPKRKPGQRGPQRTPTKEQITLRLDRDVVEHFKAGGSGWQSRINAALRRIVGKAG
jgi:uncharacterized protein (DUF4415 family)